MFIRVWIFRQGWQYNIKDTNGKEINLLEKSLP